MHGASDRAAVAPLQPGREVQIPGSLLQARIRLGAQFRVGVEHALVRQRGGRDRPGQCRLLEGGRALGAPLGERRWWWRRPDDRCRDHPARRGAVGELAEAGGDAVHEQLGVGA